MCLTNLQSIALSDARDRCVDALAEVLFGRIRHLEPESVPAKEWADMTEGERVFRQACSGQGDWRRVRQRRLPADWRLG